MKLILTALLSALTFSAAHATETINPGHPTDLKSTVAQLTSRYGKPVKVEKGWYGAGLSYEFHPSRNLYVYATTDPSQTRIEDVIYSQFTGKYGESQQAFSKGEKSRFLARNSDPHVAYWGDYGAQGTDGNWDGTEEVKRLGRERNLTVRSDLNWTWANSIVAKETEQGGYQVRTLRQFDLEQAYLR